MKRQSSEDSPTDNSSLKKKVKLSSSNIFIRLSLDELGEVLEFLHEGEIVLFSTVSKEIHSAVNVSKTNIPIPSSKTELLNNF